MFSSWANDQSCSLSFLFPFPCIQQLPTVYLYLCICVCVFVFAYMYLSFCICVFVNLYLCLFSFPMHIAAAHRGQFCPVRHFVCYWTADILLLFHFMLRNNCADPPSPLPAARICCNCVFVYLCICILVFVFVYLCSCCNCVLGNFFRQSSATFCPIQFFERLSCSIL